MKKENELGRRRMRTRKRMGRTGIRRRRRRTKRRRRMTGG